MGEPMRAVILFFSLIASAAVALAQDTYTVLGPGAISCGEFLKDLERLQSGDLFWVEGFLTGANAFSTAQHAGKDTDYEGRKTWMENYCKLHPLDHFVDAAQVLRAELIAKQ